MPLPSDSSELPHVWSVLGVLKPQHQPRDSLAKPPFLPSPTVLATERCSIFDLRESLMAITGIEVCCTVLGLEYGDKMAPVDTFEQSPSSSVGERGHYPAMHCFAGMFWGSLAIGVRKNSHIGRS